MTFTLYGEQKTSNCAEVGWVLKRPEIPYCWVDNEILNGQTKTPRLPSLNYAGQVRVIGPNDRRPPDWPRASMTCVAADTDLIPGDRYDRGDTFRWLYWEHYNPEPRACRGEALRVMAVAPIEAPQ